MATRTATVTAVVIARGSDNLITNEPEARQFNILVDNRSGSTVIGGTDTLRVADLAAAISASVRDGKTRTILGGIAVYQGGVGSDGVAYGFTVAVTGTQIDITPKASADWSTNATLPVGAMDRPFGITVYVREV